MGAHDDTRDHKSINIAPMLNYRNKGKGAAQNQF